MLCAQLIPFLAVLRPLLVLLRPVPRNELRLLPLLPRDESVVDDFSVPGISLDTITPLLALVPSVEVFLLAVLCGFEIIALATLCRCKPRLRSRRPLALFAMPL